VLRMGDPSQYMLLGVPRDVLDEQSGPGRAVVDGHEAQIAVLKAELDRLRAQAEPAPLPLESDGTRSA